MSHKSSQERHKELTDLCQMFVLKISSVICSFLLLSGFMCSFVYISFAPQGTYVLQDNKFSLLTQLSNGKQYLDQAAKVSNILPRTSKRCIQIFSIHPSIECHVAGLDLLSPCVFVHSILLFHVVWCEGLCLTSVWRV